MTSPTPTTNSGSLQVSIAPNPLPRRVAGEQVVWNVTLRGGAIGVRLDRSEAVVTDASGATFAEREDFWSKSAGCATCGQDVHLAARAEMTFSGLTANVLRTPGAGALLRFQAF